MKTYFKYILIFWILFFPNLLNSNDLISPSFYKNNDYNYDLKFDYNLMESLEIKFKQKKNFSWKLVIHEKKNFKYKDFIKNFIFISKNYSNDCYVLSHTYDDICERTEDKFFNKWILKKKNSNSQNKYNLSLIFIPQYYFYTLLYFSYFIIFLIFLNILRIRYFVK